jgi:hypothetical protein
LGLRSSRHQGNPYRGLASATLAAGALFGLGAFAVAAVFMGFDYFTVRGTPTEHALVVSLGPSGTKESCGPRSLTSDTAGERTTYRSANPPVGLPADFSVNHCPDWDDTPGEVVTLRRTGASQDDIYLHPIESASDWLGMAGVVGAVTAVIVVPAAWTKEAWRVHRAQRRRLRDLAQDQDA